jgi:putative membrane protein insertion efficiency factor
MRFIIITSALISYGLLAGAQNIDRMIQSADIHQHHHHFSLKNATNEITVSLTTLFIIYKSLISSQDGSSCTFTPSCSEYALQAINKKGVIVGSLMTFDRLTRCNGLNPDKYPYDYKRQLFIDPVE